VISRWSCISVPRSPNLGDVWPQRRNATSRAGRLRGNASFRGALLLPRAAVSKLRRTIRSSGLPHTQLAKINGGGRAALSRGGARYPFGISGSVLGRVAVSGEARARSGAPASLSAGFFERPASRARGANLGFFLPVRSPLEQHGTHSTNVGVFLGSFFWVVFLSVSV
jgi:hypothetical protein